MKKATSETRSGTTLDDRREYIQTLKEQTLALNQKIRELEGETTARVLDHVHGRGGEDNKQKWDEAIDKLGELRPLQKEMLNKIKTEEKVLKVRASVGEKKIAPTEGPGQGNRQGV
jgi:hypothetical protein